MAANGIRPAEGASVWRGADLAARTDWIVALDARDCAEIGRAADRARAAGRQFDELEAEDFPLDRVAAKLSGVGHELASGRGFALLRGLDVSAYTPDDLELIFWGLGAHLGVGVSQSAAGDRIGHVMDRGGGPERYYTRGGELEFHMDPVDVVGLLCIRHALSGGASRIVSSMAVHNEILAERPDLLAVLRRGFHVSRRAHGQPVTPDPVPVFAGGARGTECYLLPVTIRQAVEEGFPLSDIEREALACLDQVAGRAGLYLDMDFRPGDIQFLNNRAILHARTDYRDDPDPARRRHLLRLWLMMPDWPKRPDAMCFPAGFDRAGGGVRPQPTAV